MSDASARRRTKLIQRYLLNPPTKALTWLGLVIAHPAVSDGSRTRATELLETWGKVFSKEKIDAELERGKTLDLMEVVREILSSPA